MTGRTILFAAIAVALLMVAVRMFRRDPDDLGDQEAAEAARFNSIWEVWDASPTLTASRKGLVTPAEVQQAAQNADKLGLAIHALSEAPGNWYAWSDDEKTAIGAVMRATYPEQLLFGDLFKATKGTTVGAFLRSFMSPGRDDEWLSAIVRHVEKLRSDHAQQH